MDTIKNTVNAASDKVSELANAGSKEANKNVAKDSNVDTSTRLSAGKDAVGDKLSETKDKASYEGNKEAAKH